MVFDLKINSHRSLLDIVSEVGQSRTIKVGDEWILVLNTKEQYPDVIKDLKELLNDLDIEDICYLNSLMLVGNKKTIEVDSNFVTVLLGDKSKSQVIINRIKNELDRDFGYRLYNRGPHSRLAIRVPIHEIKDFIDDYTARIKEIILKDCNITPDNTADILSVYLIADETYVRLEPDTFFTEIFNLKKKENGDKTVSSKTKPSTGIILGESPDELMELALAKLKDYYIYRDIQLVDIAGLTYDFDAIAIMENDRILLNYSDTITINDILYIKMCMEAFNANRTWILTSQPKDEIPSELLCQDDISIMAMKDL